MSDDGGFGAIMDDVHKGLLEAGAQCFDTNSGTLCHEIADFLFECGWRHPGIKDDLDHIAAPTYRMGGM